VWLRVTRARPPLRRLSPGFRDLHQYRRTSGHSSVPGPQRFEFLHPNTLFSTII